MPRGVPPSVCFAIAHRQLPPQAVTPFGRCPNSYVKPPSPRKVDFAKQKTEGVACPERGGGFRVSESRRGYNEASVVYANPSVKPSVCQLPVRGAFWYCIASNIKHGDGFPSPQLHKLLRSPAVRRISHCASNISLRVSAISPVHKNGFHRGRKPAYPSYVKNPKCSVPFIRPKRPSVVGISPASPLSL